LEHEQIRIRLQNELEQTKHYSHELERQLFDKDEAQKNVNVIIDQYRQQLTTEKELRLSKKSFVFLIEIKSLFYFIEESDTELDHVRSRLLRLTNDYEQLNAIKAEFQTNESNTRRKIDEINRSRQAVLDRTRDEYEKLLRKYTDLDEVYREFVNSTCKNKSFLIEIIFFS
jgi:hypothetical protein